jgi:hypothetical protein
MENKTLLVIIPGRNTKKSIFSLLVAETGEFLTSRFCTNSDFAYGDLYLTREDKVKEYKERFGEVEVKYIDETDISVAELKSRNKKWFESLPKK